MSTSEQLTWDFDNRDAAEVRPDTGTACFVPGSERRIAALQSTDDDVIRLDCLDTNMMTAEAAARLWAHVAARVGSDQIAYHIDDSPVSSDTAYDARMRYLERPEAALPSLDNPQLPARHVGGSSSNDFAPVRHSSHMMNLDDVFSTEGLKDWYGSVIRDLDWSESKPLPMSCEVKIDDLALNLIYRNSVLERGLMRGDDATGEDITLSVQAIGSTPTSLIGPKEDVPDFVGIQGEVFMHWDDFCTPNSKQGGAGRAFFANPRNAAAGSLRQKDSHITTTHRPSSYVHGLGQFTWEPDHPCDAHSMVADQSQAYDLYTEWDVPVSLCDRAATSFQEILDMVEYYDEYRGGIEHALDDIVVEVDDLGLQCTLGVVSRASRWAITYKYPSEETNAELSNITVQMGCTGRVTPVAVPKPVYVVSSIYLLYASPSP